MVNMRSERGVTLWHSCVIITKERVSAPQPFAKENYNQVSKWTMIQSKLFFPQQALHISPYIRSSILSLVFSYLNTDLLCVGEVAVILFTAFLLSLSASQNDHLATDRQAEDPAGQSERIPSEIHTKILLKWRAPASVRKRSLSTDRLMN